MRQGHRKTTRLGDVPGRGRRWRAGRLIALSVATVMAVAACGGSSAATSTAGDGASPAAGPGGPASAGGSAATLTLYSGQHEQTTNKLVAAFTAQTGIGVKVRSDDEAVLAQQMVQEGSKSPADVFFTENSPPLVQLDESGLLSPVAAGTLAEVPPQYSAPTKNWVGVSARVSALVYNTDALSPSQLPKSVLDLADPKWAGKLSISPGETDFQPIVTAVELQYGRSAAVNWLKGLKKNAGSHVDPDNEALVANVNKGITEIGVINHYYWYRLQAELGASKLHSKLAYFAADDPGYLVDVSGAGVLKSSKHQAEDQKLLAFLVSASGERVLAGSDSFEYPVGSGAAANPALTPFDTLHPRDLTIAQLGDGKAAVRLLQDAGLL
jgi:iron(III) transport system substrate-binding protein